VDGITSTSENKQVRRTLSRPQSERRCELTPYDDHSDEVKQAEESGDSRNDNDRHCDTDNLSYVFRF
jgi:hypothetical protein